MRSARYKTVLSVAKLQNVMLILSSCKTSSVNLSYYNQQGTELDCSNHVIYPYNNWETELSKLNKKYVMICAGTAPVRRTAELPVGVNYPESVNRSYYRTVQSECTTI